VVRHFPPRAYAIVTGAVALTMLAARVASSSSTSGSGGFQYHGTAGAGRRLAGAQPRHGAHPQRGGNAQHESAISDVDYMDL